MSNAITFGQMIDKIKARLAAAFPTASVQEGWPQVFLNGNKTWPLITVAPVVDNATMKPAGSQTEAIFEVRLMLPATPGVMRALISHRHTVRRALIGLDPSYERTLIGVAKEIDALQYHEPLPNMPFAGFTFVLQTNFFEKPE
ncbi:hypothetical protein MM188_003219 [Vibrio cholerae]|nr:hypothetical protein [Vibrio cholerae]